MLGGQVVLFVQILPARSRVPCGNVAFVHVRDFPARRARVALLIPRHIVLVIVIVGNTVCRSGNTVIQIILLFDEQFEETEVGLMRGRGRVFLRRVLIGGELGRGRAGNTVPRRIDNTGGEDGVGDGVDGRGLLDVEDFDGDIWK